MFRRRMAALMAGLGLTLAAAAPAGAYWTPGAVGLDWSGPTVCWGWCGWHVTAQGLQMSTPLGGLLTITWSPPVPPMPGSRLFPFPWWSGRR
jgi:hypothetical protein